MKLNKLTILTLGMMATTLIFSCSKKSDDNNAALGLALASSSIVPTTGPGCDRTKKECLISLIAGKTWYMVGSAQQPKNLLGFQEAIVNAFTCYAKTKADIQVGSGGNDLVFTVDNALGSVSGTYPSAICNRNVSSNYSGSPTTSNASTITPVSENCFNIDVTYNTIVQQGRGVINQDGTELKLELYRKDNADPSNHRCENGAVGERNTGLTPDSTSCDNAQYVCDPTTDSNYNNVQIYDLVE